MKDVIKNLILRILNRKLDEQPPDLINTIQSYLSYLELFKKMLFTEKTEITQ